MRREEISPSKHPLLRTAVMNEEYFGIVESLMLEVKSLRLQLDLLSSRGLLEDEQSARGEKELNASGLEALVNETLEAAGCSDLQSLRGPRRVRRLEILLAAALDRERRCELRRHKMDRFSQYLNSTLERKEEYFDALRSYFSGLVDYAAGEACYLPEFTARLVLFRQQLAQAHANADGRHTAEMLDGTIEAFLVAEEGLDGTESPSGLCYVSTQNLLEHELSTRSRSYSYGYLLGEAARRNGRRSTSHMKQPSTARLSGAPSLTESSKEPDLGRSGPDQLAELRAENALLRRQLENHPELYRLSAENRFLREHMAMLVQQKASVHQDSDFYRPRGEEEMSLARTTSRLRSHGSDRESRREAGTQAFSLKNFPGIEEVTHLSSDSDSEIEAEEPREDRGAVPADVTSFLPAMARQVQDLFRVKNSLEEALRQQLRARCGREARYVEREVPVSPEALAEGLERATRALQHAEAMLVGGGGELFLGNDEGGDGLSRPEGMDERDVFLSLMRSLPGESQALKREGLAASSESKRKRSSGGGGCLQRMKSTMQLHRIVEAPNVEMADAADSSETSTPGEQLRLTIQQVRNLNQQLEGIGEMYKEVKGQMQPMQQEYSRRLDECRFLEAQFRRLDVHCRLLEDRFREATRLKPLKVESQVTSQPLSQTVVMPSSRFTPVSMVPAPVQAQSVFMETPGPPMQRSVSLTPNVSWAQPSLAASARQMTLEARRPEMHVMPQQELLRVVSAPLIHSHSVPEPRREGARGASAVDAQVMDVRQGTFRDAPGDRWRQRLQL